MAYYAFLLISGYESLKLMPFLKQSKQQWNTSTPKYAGILVCRNCDAEIGGRTIELEQHQKGKGQIRSVFSTATAHPEDLFAPMLESPRPGGVLFFIKIRRKGHRQAMWEQLLQVPASPFINPLDL